MGRRLLVAVGSVLSAIAFVRAPALALDARVSVTVPPTRHLPATAHPVPESEPPIDACPSLDPARYELPPYDESAIDAPLPLLVDPSDQVMAKFHERVAALLRGRTTEPVRIGIYGDSNMTQDGISGGMRRMLQKKLGDSGHGYVALGRAWPWYLHMDVKHGAHWPDWKAYSTSVQPAPDTYYGFANVAFDSARRGAMTYAETADPDAPVGRAVGRFEAYFLKRPRGGSFIVRIDGVDTRTVSATAPRPVAGFERFEVPDGPHRFELIATSDDPVRVFGVSMERTLPGVVVDSLGTGALNYEQMTRVERSSRRAMLEERRYDLVMFLLGSNVYAPNERVSTDWIRNVIDAHREARPGLPVVLLSPTDIAPAMDAKRSDPRIRALVPQLRRSAEATGAAYWDFWSAMGGDLSIVRLRKQIGLASSDLIHLTRKSGRMMGERLAHALMRDFARYVSAHPKAGCEARPQPAPDPLPAPAPRAL
jgi:hypothetical protein